MADWLDVNTDKVAYWPAPAGVPTLDIVHPSPNWVTVLLGWLKNGCPADLNFGNHRAANVSVLAFNGGPTVTAVASGIVTGLVGIASADSAPTPVSNLALGYSTTTGGWIQSFGARPLSLNPSGNGVIVNALGPYASDAAAGTAGLTANMIWKDSSGGLHVKL